MKSRERSMKTSDPSQTTPKRGMDTNTLALTPAETATADTLARTTESFEKVAKRFWAVYGELNDKKPDFGNMEKTIRDITEEIDAFDNEFAEISYDEETAPNRGGGVKRNENTIKYMQRAIPKLKSMVAKAEELFHSNESLYGPYWGQIVAAKKITEALETWR